MLNLKRISFVLLVWLMVCLPVYSGNAVVINAAEPSLSQKENKPTKAVDDKDKGKQEKAIGKFLKKISFKDLKHHHDSVSFFREFVHEQHLLLKDKKNNPFNISVDHLGLKIETYKPGTQFNLQYEIFGFYPYWEEDYCKSLNYSLLSTVAYFAYQVDPATGKNKATNNWESAAVIDSVKANGKRLLLTLCNFGEADNKAFLNNKKAINVLIDQVKQQLKIRGADGVCVDFEGVAENQKTAFTSFIYLLKQELTKADKKYLVYITVPNVDWQKSLDFQALKEVVDRFVIMGYGYYGATSSVAGPVSPIQSGKTWEPFNIVNSVDYYIQSGLPNNKIILCLPFYGAIWDTENANLAAKVKSFVGYRPYNYIQSQIHVPTRIDTVSETAWSVYLMDNKTKAFRQCWYENDTTFKVKLNYSKAMNLAGIGIWALGYEKGYNILWDAIANVMCDNEVKLSDNLSKQVHKENPSFDPGKQTAAGKSAIASFLKELEAIVGPISDYKALLLYLMILVVFFAGIGFVIAMFQPDTRMFLLGNAVNAGYYTAVFLLFLVVILRFARLINDNAIFLLLGFIAGGIATYYITRLLNKINRNKP